MAAGDGASSVDEHPPPERLAYKLRDPPVVPAPGRRPRLSRPRPTADRSSGAGEPARRSGLDRTTQALRRLTPGGGLSPSAGLRFSQVPTRQDHSPQRS